MRKKKSNILSEGPSSVYSTWLQEMSWNEVEETTEDMVILKYDWLIIYEFDWLMMWMFTINLND